MKNVRIALLWTVTCSVAWLGNGTVTGQEPGWASDIVVNETVRQQVDATPIVDRPYRPLHFYGNTVRRVYYRGTALPAPRDFRQGLQAATRRPYVPVQAYLPGTAW